MGNAVHEHLEAKFENRWTGLPFCDWLKIIPARVLAEQIDHSCRQSVHPWSIPYPKVPLENLEPAFIVTATGDCQCRGHNYSNTKISNPTAFTMNLFDPKSVLLKPVFQNQLLQVIESLFM